MNHEITITTESINEYCKLHTTPPSNALKTLALATQELGTAARMQVGVIEGRFLSILTGLLRAKNVLEFGTFTGYSALSFAEALPEGGKVATLDRDPSAHEIAKKHWAMSPHGKKIEPILGDAKESILKLATEIRSGLRPPFDVAFIDADKAGYPHYWDACFDLVKSGGAILVDNVLWSGRILNPQDASDHDIANFNEKVSKDFRVEHVMLSVRDGLTVARIR
jgi:caffeoyl-CoA O-methyltransferase